MAFNPITQQTPQFLGKTAHPGHLPLSWIPKLYIQMENKRCISGEHPSQVHNHIEQLTGSKIVCSPESWEPKKNEEKGR